MHKKITILAIAFFCMLGIAQAQLLKYRPFESKQGFLITPTYGYQKPEGDLAKRFGNSSSIGLDVRYKTESNWLFGFEYNWMFSRNVLETGMFDTIIGSTGQIIDQDGLFSVYRFNERGHTFFLKGGHIIPFNKVNKNSGILVEAGFGFMAHKIDIFSSTVKIPQLAADYLKGYDRFTGGWAAKQFLGYQNLDPKKRINFYIGMEAIEGWTHSLRSYDFDTRMKDTRKRFDMVWGLKLGVSIPIYTKDPNEEEFFTD